MFCHSPDSFEGHYLLLTGFVNGYFTYQDPAYPPSRARGETSRLLAPAVLDRARKSFGTDEDVLMVEVPPLPTPPSPKAEEGGEGTAGIGQS